MSWNASEWLLDRHVVNGGGERPALRTAGGPAISYAQLLTRVASMAAGLRQRGVEASDRVVLAMLDSPEFAVSFLACLRIGAIAVPVNPLLPWRDLGVVIADAGPRLVLVSAERAAGSEEVSTPRLVTGTPEWDEVAAATGDTSTAATEADSPGFWLCTSGSTGRPKLAMHRHTDLQVTADTYARSILDIAPDDRFFSVGPMFHAYGLGNSLSFPMSVGAVAILEPTRPPTACTRRPDRAATPADSVLRHPGVLRGTQRIRHRRRHISIGAPRGVSGRVASRGDLAPLP